jgi:glutamate dehydrogenase (NADP+)
MPTTPGGVELFIDAKILYGPGKAANAGGVAVSGLEMAQNSMRYAWTREEVDNRLAQIMMNIHDASVAAADKYGSNGNYVDGANIAGFIKVADANSCRFSTNCSKNTDTSTVSTPSRT